MGLGEISSKVLTFFGDNTAILSGTALHLLVTTKKARDAGESLEWLDMVLLASISVFLGFFMQSMIIGYYSHLGLESKEGVVVAGQWLGSALGFPGITWLVAELMGKFDELFNFVLGLPTLLSAKDSKHKKEQENKRATPSEEEFFNQFEEDFKSRKGVDKK